MDNISSATSNSYRQYKLGTEAMFTWLSDSLDKTGITLTRSLEDSSIRSEYISTVPYGLLFVSTIKGQQLSN